MRQRMNLDHIPVHRNRDAVQSMIPKKPAPDLIRGGHRFSEKIMLKQKSRRYGAAGSHAAAWITSAAFSPIM
jgi:hypothetical protein